MQRSGVCTVTIVLAVAGAAHVACSALIGAEEGTLYDAGVAHDDSPALETTDDSAACSSSPQRTVDEAAGIFVATTGIKDHVCGTKSAPCATVQLGIDRTNEVSGRSIVYIAAGAYVESITLRSGLTLEGGWSAAWLPLCAEPSRAVVIQGTTGTTVRAEALASDATIATLTIISKPQRDVGASESLFGIMALGATTRLRLRDVVVHVGDGGSGASGAKGVDGANGGSDCAASDGANGAGEGSTGQPAAPGVFSSSGYAPSSGRTGTVGLAGHNGVAGSTPSCVSCVTCSGTALDCKATAAPASCGTSGKPGCGGAGGQPGQGGGGGGSSVALFTWDAVVSVGGGELNAGKAGAGGAGGPGGSGGTGTAGKPGGPGSICTTGCGPQTLSCVPTAGGAGNAGGVGGTGGGGSRGGAGSAGAAGFSYPIYLGGAGTVNAIGVRNLEPR